jgi:hypothetical protein
MQFPKVKKRLTDLFSSQEKTVSKSLRIALSTAMMGLGLVSLGDRQNVYGGGANVPSTYAVIENRNKRQSIWKLILDPVSQLIPSFRGHSSHRSHSSHSSHRSHSSHSSHYSGSSVPSTSPPQQSPPAIVAPERQPSTTVPVVPATPANVKTPKAMFTVIRLDTSAKVLYLLDKTGTAIALLWTDVTRVKKSDGTIGGVNDISSGRIAEIAWIETDQRYIALDVNLLAEWPTEQDMEKEIKKENEFKKERDMR